MFTAQAVGRLTANPTLETTAGGTKVCKFRLATTRARGREGANFIEVAVYGDAAADANHKYLTKGREVAVSGDIDHRQWKNDNGYGERFQLVANSVQWLSKPKATDPEAADESAPTDADTGSDAEAPVEVLA